MTLRRTRLFAAVILSLALAPSSPRASASAQSDRIGVGVVLGEPSGLSAKYWLRSRDALDFGLAYSFNHFFGIFSDYLYHFPAALSSLGAKGAAATQISPYIGVGAILLVDTSSSRSEARLFTGSGSSAGLGVRIPLGVEWRPSHPPLGVFAELVPGLGIVPSTFGFLDAGIGLRFYF